MNHKSDALADMSKVKHIRTVGVVGAGTMGTAIAQKFAQQGFDVYLNDRNQQLVDKGIFGIKTVLEQAVERNIFKPEVVQNVMAKIRGIVSLKDLVKCDLIIEAVYEDFEVKSQLFKSLDKLIPHDTILATNTSSFLVTDLAKSVSNPGRFIGLHYFYHAAKNRLVEIIPGEDTTQETFLSIEIFCAKTGKDVIITKDKYGFAVNRFFVPWLNEAVKLLGEGKVTADEIDIVSMKTLGIGMGPFALMNSTGIAITLHAQNTFRSFGPAYAVAHLLEQQVASGNAWEVSREENLFASSEKEKLINERLLGCIFFVCTQILNEHVCSAADLNRGARIGLKWKYGPVELMIRYGEKEVKKLIEQYCNLTGELIPEEINFNDLYLEYVTLDVCMPNAVITFSKPEDLNVLNKEIVDQLELKFKYAESLPEVKNIFITGSGKAFMAGADVKYFVNNIKTDHIDNIVSFTKHAHEVFDRIDKSSKKIIAVLNGLTLGGGMELALCADLILAYPDVKLAFPETGIGIYPGLGGTQRTVMKIGKGLSKYLVLTGKTLNASEANEIGLVDRIILVEEFYELLYGEMVLPESAKPPIPEKWRMLEHLFEENNYKSILDGTYQNGGMEKSEISKLVSVLCSKAPLAMNVAEQLIDQAMGTQSELDKLATVFSTKDALIGLTTLGKNAVFTGT